MIRSWPEFIDSLRAGESFLAAQRRLSGPGDHGCGTADEPGCACDLCRLSGTIDDALTLAHEAKKQCERAEELAGATT